MTFEYFSDNETGPIPRTADIVSPQVWGGIVAAVNSLISNGGFGEDFPAVCPDGAGVTGTDEQAFVLAMQAEVPNISWPLETSRPDEASWSSRRIPFTPNTLAVLDFVQFCYNHVSDPIQRSHHSYFGHYHLSFDRATGREQFQERINRIFARNGLSFELQGNGSVIRLAPPVLAELTL